MAGLSLFLLLVAGGLTWGLLSHQTYQARPHRPAAQVQPAAAADALHGLERAVDDRDVGAARALAGGDRGAAALLGSVVGNARKLQVEDFTLRYVDEEGGTSPDGSWPAAVVATWRFAGFDRQPEQMEVRFRFAEHDGRLGIAGIGGGGRRTPLWLTGPLRVRRTATSLVLVQGSNREADRVAGLARAAVPQVRAVLPDWRGGLVLEVPATQQGLERALHARPGQYDAIAAVTTTVSGSRSRSAPVHVYVNPAVFLPLKPHGAQVVVTHEATHVATGAATSPAPIWLVEGFADYVALRVQRLPLTTTASRISALVHRQGPPSRLPGQTEFAAGASHLEARYESAWLACRLLANSGGAGALVGFYRAVDAGRALGPELRDHFGFGLRGLTARWRTLLSHLPA